MPFASSNSARFTSNIPAQANYNALQKTLKSISERQLNLSTGKQVNNAADNVADYPTSRILNSRNSTLKAALEAVADAKNVSTVIMESLDNIGELMLKVKQSVSFAASGAQGADEKIALAKAAYRLSEQIQTVVDSTVFGGRSLIDGTFSADFVISSNAANSLLTLSIDMGTGNTEFNIESNDFNLNSLSVSGFAGITGLDLSSLNNISESDLGIFSDEQIGLTLSSITDAIDNISKVGSYVGGFSNRLDSQEEMLLEQITNYKETIGRIEDADVAKEQMELVKKQFLQQSNLYSFSQANVTPQSYLRLLER